MTIFTDIESAEPGGARPRRRSGWLGWGVLAAVLIGVTVVSLLPSPYVIEKPGPVYDTLGSTSVDGADVPLIDIPVQRNYPTDGSLDMLTVSIAGSRERTASWMEVVAGWLTPSDEVIPVERVYPDGETLEQSNEAGRIEMQNSQKEAVAAALTALGYQFSSTLTVEEALVGSPSDGVLRPGDVVTAVDGATFTDVSGLRQVIDEHGTDTPAVVSIVRDGVASEVEITPVLSTGANPVPVIGVTLSSDYEFPFEVVIQLENVGGPSAGQMFALGIYDKLTPGALTGGEEWAGTGTIDGGGTVGPIGGIRQKLYGARDAGAEYFLAPASNCDEVTGHIPRGLTVYSTTSLSESITAIETVAAGGDTAALPSCPTD